MNDCRYRGVAYRGCDGQMYRWCAGYGRDIPVEECPLYNTIEPNPQNLCPNYEPTTFENEDDFAREEAGE